MCKHVIVSIYCIACISGVYPGQIWQQWSLLGAIKSVPKKADVTCKASCFDLAITYRPCYTLSGPLQTIIDPIWGAHNTSQTPSSKWNIFFFFFRHPPKFSGWTPEYIPSPLQGEEE